ncbi:MAG: hypothetical protein Tp138OMZ00d2C19078241_4 [Prokaryotic dsDNA virus sp.]|jgi:hypothetical protein|nr:MAG: hypothetical protein Tp138OMZ00d2C19078241_4 [Prokaryotic dsDNA virus sp.]|tara:strand:- start:24505 stop:24948 length:444 start_codon:yes stop_codon:yes gene_type:complete
MTVYFPAQVLVQSKSVERSEMFRDAAPAVGHGYSIKQFSAAVKIIGFDVIVRRDLAKYFDAWCYEHENDWFQLTYSTPSGLFEQEVHFTADGVPQLTSEDAASVRYSMEVVTRAFVPDDSAVIMTGLFGRFNELLPTGTLTPDTRVP